MREFEVIIEETISQTFKIKAKSLEDALNIATEKYNNCEIVLDSNILTGKQIKAIDTEEKEETNWIEF